MKKLLIGIGLALAVSLAPLMAKAATVYHYETKKGNDAYEYYNDKGQYQGTYYYDKEGKYLGYWNKKTGETIPAKSNPNPEGDAKGIEPLDIKALLEKYRGDVPELPPEFWTTDLGQHLIEKGKGPLPAINPNPEDNVGGHNSPKQEADSKPKDNLPWNPLNKRTEEEKIGGIDKKFEFEPNAGSPGEQIKGAIAKGPTGDRDPSTPDKKDAVTTGAYFGDLPGPPELVNPAWGGKETAKLSGPDDAGKSKALIPIDGGKGTTQGSAKAIIPIGGGKAKLGTSDDGKSAKGLVPAVKTKTALKCGPSTTPNAQGTACLPKLDMQGLDSTIGSSGGGMSGPGGVASRRR